jgi:DNA-directed RNA polymerase subunit A"
VKHLVDAAVRGEVDELKGVVENVMVGSRIVPLGTGIVKLLMLVTTEEQSAGGQ